MNVNNLLGNNLTSPLTNVDAIGASSARQSSIPPAMGAAATATISTPGQFFSEMQQLSQQNPTEFKAVAAQVATSFQNAASQASGPQAQALTKLANLFSQASQTGTLQPAQAAQTGAVGQVSGAAGSQGAHHHHHRHGGGMSGDGQSSAMNQAFQNAMSILTQAVQGTSTTSASSPAATST